MTDLDPFHPPRDQTGAPAHDLGLLGVEIGASTARLALLDPLASELVDMVEQPFDFSDDPLNHSAQVAVEGALLAGLEAIGLTEPTPLLVGATIGVADCGVGSGPALQNWIKDLSGRLNQPFLCAGERGVSYAPVAAATFLRRVFEPLPIHLNRIELAPVAASRVIAPMHRGAMTLGSGIAWSARVVGNEVLEAYEVADGPVEQVLKVADGSDTGAVERIEWFDGVEVSAELCRRRRMMISTLAPAVGVAVALLTTPPTNLLAAETIGTSRDTRSNAPAAAPGPSHGSPPPSPSNSVARRKAVP